MKPEEQYCRASDLHWSEFERDMWRRLPYGPNYNDLSLVDSVTTVDFAGAPLKIVSHADIPKGEVHLVENGKCVGKIINCE